MDAESIVKHMTDAGFVSYIKNLRPQERRMLYFSLGADIRNSYLLWHPKNPYTMVPLKSIPPDRKNSSSAHPDNYSWFIIRQLIVAADMSVFEKDNDVNATESLIYTLTCKSDDSFETLESIRESVEQLVANYRWDLLDEIYAEMIVLGSSPVKVKVLLDATGDNTTKITPVNYLRVAKRSISDDFHENSKLQP
jgi:hypothetical protein